MRSISRLGALAASPFPRLEVTKKYFTFERIAAKGLSPEADEAKNLALRMKPIDAELRKHLDEVSVLLEISSGLVLRAETIDADGDRTVMKFSNIKTNSGSERQRRGDGFAAGRENYASARRPGWYAALKPGKGK